VTFDEYQLQALATRPKGSLADLLLLATIGLVSTNGKLATLLKRFLLKKGDMDQRAVVKLLGAQLWYLTLAAETVGETLDTVAQHNLWDIEVKQ
jgi:hypothetical protein